MTPVGFAVVAFALTLAAVMLSKPHPAAWGCSVPFIIAIGLFAYIIIARPGSSTAPLIIPFGFAWAALGSVPAAFIGAWVRCRRGP